MNTTTISVTIPTNQFLAFAVWCASVDVTPSVAIATLIKNINKDITALKEKACAHS